jgi:carboxymethylenebutenolidase
VVSQIDQALEEAGVSFWINYYPQANHGFFCDRRSSYHAESAHDAWHQTLNWFKTYLA